MDFVLEINNVHFDKECYNLDETDRYMYVK